MQSGPPIDPADRGAKRAGAGDLNMFRRPAIKIAVLICIFGWPVSSWADPPAAVNAPRIPQHASRPAVPSKPLAKAFETSPAAEMSVADLTAKVRDSIVVISVIGRDGERSTIGAGFAVGKGGLIATNLHVIGEARPIDVATADGRKFPVSEIHATDRTADLAVIRVNGLELAPLPLGDSDATREGEEVIAIGNPRGLEHSVVSGVISGIRTIDATRMIQIAMPIEQGNSGGPLLDRRGRVLGLVTMKSVVTENLGFAVAINALKPLLSKPNPVPIEHWLTIGALDPSEWGSLFGAHWRQRAGRIVVEGPGNGLGERTLLLSKRTTPPLPFELAVWVRLDHEEGAAGLAFHFHEPDRHYGFYPSNGRIRFTRFDGPDFYSWHVLHEVETPAYRPGAWNRFKVRFEKGKTLGYVNDVLVVESTDDTYSDGQVGLSSFRRTHAEFKGFEIGKNLPTLIPSPEMVSRVDQIAAAMKTDQPPDSKTIEPLVADSDSAVRALRQRADQREQEAKQLRRFAQAIRVRRAARQISALFEGKKENEIDLLRVLLLVAQIDNEDLDVDAYVREVDRIATDVRASLPKNADSAARLDALDNHLFKKLGFHGSRTDFYSRSNSYLNEVIDDREGLPITLSVLYIELARRLQVDVVGVGLPGRFLVRLASVQDSATLIDVYDGARRLSKQHAEELARAFTEEPIGPENWQPQTKRQILQRLVQNLEGRAEDSNDAEGMLRYTDIKLAVDPASLKDHWRRALLCYQTGRKTESLREVNWLLGNDPEKLSKAADPSQIRQLKELLESQP